MRPAPTASPAPPGRPLGSATATARPARAGTVTADGRPQTKLSRARTRHCRAQWTAARPALASCPCPRRETIPAHHACPVCGHYRGCPVASPSS